ncbi:DUF2157 domain-containing protein [Salinithrix halophila]|uniref:DUF2157 domain-containing protein n=1 Tax=Salinithrix halophila TaxID=1485204 RepID=A0ABV8JC92_9BACL
MSRKWLKKEGEEWVKEGIVTEGQLRHILERYPAKTIQGQLLPILAAVLIGLAILSYTASNWNGIPPLVRLSILIAAIATFYGAGEIRTSRGHSHTGASLTGLGVICFGAAMILVGQMFHLTAFDARLFILWGLSALGALYLYRHPALFFLPFLILTASQIYSVATFDRFSWITAVLFTLGLAWDAQRRGGSLYRWLTGVGIVFQAMMGVVAAEISPLWMVGVAAAVYTLTEVFQIPGWAFPLRVPAMAVGFISTLLWFYQSPQEVVKYDLFALPDWRWTAPIFLILFSLSLWRKKSEGQFSDTVGWILFLPWYFLTQAMPEGIHTVIYLLVLYTFTVHTLMQGFKKESRLRINTGILLFLLVTLNAYFNLAWDFLPKSLFFFIGGLLLFGLNFLLQRRKRVSFSQGGEAR